MKRGIVVALIGSLMAVVSFAQENDPKQEQKQLQVREQSYNDSPGLDAHGGIARHGSEFKMIGGPHGPFGPGPDDAEEKDSILFFSEGLEDPPAGQMLQHIWGPGGSGIEHPCSAFGPNFDGDSPGGGEPSDDPGSRAQSRAGRG